ncbi:MAG: hypothetical protein ACO1TE_12630 [Prosthecobacter sp.]
MEPYGHLNRDSGVTAFDLGKGWIRVRFQDGTVYEYTAASVGRRHLSQMKRLAEAGHGLSTYISTHPEVRDGYVAKTAAD